MTDYWRETAAHDYETMRALFKSKRYDASLFFGHLMLEKVLKGLIIKNSSIYAPKIHDLVRLMEVAKISLSSRDVKLLNDATEFNMEARYPEWKLAFYKRCTKQYTEKYINGIDDLYKILCQMLEQKK